MNIATTSNEHLLESWIAEYKDCLTIIKSQIFCNTCKKYISCQQKSQVSQHIKGKKHSEPKPADYFYPDLCEAFIAANIPLAKLQNQVLRNFLKKYTDKNIPHETTLRKYYLPQCYEKIINLIKADVADNFLWVSADETRDITGRCVINVVVGILHPVLPYKPYLIASRIEKDVNAEIIATIINESLDIVFDDEDIKFKKILLFISDSTPYMIKTGQLLKQLYPHILHLTCIARALHRISEYIGNEFPIVDRLIITFKEIFLQSPQRINIYKTKYPDLPLPPVPITTRWGTWLDACEFYAKNLITLKYLVLSLDDDDQNIIDCKTILQEPSLLTDLQFIQNHFNILPSNIKFFENQNVSLKEGLERLTHLLQTLKSVPGDFGHNLNEKINSVFEENPDLLIFEQMYNEKFHTEDLKTRYAQFVEYFNHPPLSSCDVERTFSVLKNVFTSNRRRYSEENLEKVLIINANNSILCRTE